MCKLPVVGHMLPKCKSNLSWFLMILWVSMQVLDEIGIDVAAQMSSAPKGKIGRKTRAEDAGSSGVDDLEQRMSTLRNS
jgi:hypothetical protein